MVSTGSRDGAHERVAGGLVQGRRRGAAARHPGRGRPGRADRERACPGYGARGQPPGSWRVRAGAARFRQRVARAPPAQRTRRQPACRAPGRAGGRGVGAPRGGGRRWLRPRRIFGIIALVLVVVIVATVGLVLLPELEADPHQRAADYSGRPAAAAGTNWLITGSDSRQGLTRAQSGSWPPAATSAATAPTPS